MTPVLPPPSTEFDARPPIPLGGDAEAILTRSVVCDMNGDHHRDIITIDGNSLTFLHGPGVYTSRTRLLVQANDVVVRVGVTPDGYDEILTVGDQGVRRVWFSFTGTAEDTVQIADLGSAAWINARRIMLAKSDDQGTDLLVGLDSSGHSILLMQDPWGTATDLPPIPSSAEILDLCIADVSGDRESELCVMTTENIQVRSLAGTTLLSLPSPQQGGFLLPFRQDGFSKERLLGVARPMGVEGSFLYVMSDGVVEAPQYLGDVHVHGGAIGDLDDDGDDDFIFSYGNEGEALTLALANNASTGAPSAATLTFSAAEGLSLINTDGASPLAATHLALPLVADFNNDDDLDIAYLSQSDRNLVIVENRRVDHRDLMLRPSMPESFIALDPDSSAGRLDLSLAPPLVGAEEFDHILVEQWVQPSAAGIHRAGAYRFVRDAPQVWSTPISLELWDDRINRGYLQHLDIRTAQLDGQGNVLRVGPTTIVSLGLFTPSTDWLVGYYAAIGVDITPLLDEIPWDWESDYASNNPSPPGSGSLTQPYQWQPPLILFGTSTLGPAGGPLPDPPDHEDDGPPPIPPILDPDT